MTAESPLGEWVELEAVPPKRHAKVPAPPPPAAAEPEVEEAPAEAPPTAGWHDSTRDLMSGVVVTDETDSMPGELFERLFLENEPARSEPAAPARPREPRRS